MRPAPEALPYLDPVQTARLGLLHRLRDLGYSFTTPAPATHRRILLRRGRRSAENLADVFGWNMAFEADVLPPGLFEIMDAGQMLVREGDRYVSALRVASLADRLFLHSAFPVGKDAVFFGPDSYRFADFIRVERPDLRADAVIVDIGTGAGVGGIVAQGLEPTARLILTDVNPTALGLARVNAALAGVTPELVESDGLPDTPGLFDLIVANPPYIGAETGKTYSDGGGALGGEITLRWAKEAAGRLAPGGTLLLYSGAAIVRGRDPMREALGEIAKRAGCAFTYRELDPDVFPGTLLHRPYWKVERIAAFGALLTKT